MMNDKRVTHDQNSHDQNTQEKAERELRDDQLDLVSGGAGKPKMGWDIATNSKR